MIITLILISALILINNFSLINALIVINALCVLGMAGLWLGGKQKVRRGTAVQLC